MSLRYNPSQGCNGGSGFNPPSTGNQGGGSSGATSPSLITSTGGLNGAAGILMAPAINTVTGKAVIVYFNPGDFDCEENCEYDFRQEADFGQIPAEGRSGTFHLIILKYRELGYASFFVNITVFDKTTDSFITTSLPVTIPPIPLKTKARQQSFPDKKIHTLRLYPKIQGERPQVTITRNANSGPESVTRLTLCGNADEMAQQ